MAAHGNPFEGIVHQIGQMSMSASKLNMIKGFIYITETNTWKFQIILLCR